ncbi:MAG: DUF4331 family protein [Acidobacteria bacterium]|nr:DUF4331 family protein [Acidobacteriota bacterium]MBV9435325.1 DUF4331 family protein [Acidobacteriota bacterium]
MKKSASFLAIFLFMLGVVSFDAPKLSAADHREAPLVDGIPEGDITDVYLFTDPNDATRMVMIMNVNPFSVPAETPSYSLSPDLLYQFKIDNTGDAREDLVVQVVVDINGQGQTIRVFGPAAPTVTGARNGLLSGAPSAQGAFGNVIGSATGVQAFVGVRDDPFVFDVGQFFRILNGTQDVFRQIGTSFRGRAVRSDGTSGVDGFGGFNVTSIVVSVPKAMVRGSTSKINMWATVSQRVPERRGGGNTFTQFERMGQQAFATVFVPKGTPRDAQNAEIPEHDVANYSSLIPDALTVTDNDGTGNTIAGRANLLTALGLTALPNGAPLLLPGTFGNTSKDLLRIALLPDVLRFDLDLPATGQAIGQFGIQNGRHLNDPSIDIALQLLRQLADVHFPTGVTGGGPVGTRAALECSAFPSCQDRRVLVVVQGTTFNKPDAQLTDFTIEGNDMPFLSQFPYIASPHPLPGEPGTIGFPPQQ